MATVPAARRQAGVRERDEEDGSDRSGDAAPARAASERAEQALLEDLLTALQAVREGDFSARLNTRRRGLLGEIAAEFNELAATNQRMAKELVRVGRIIGREGRMTERAALTGASGAWATSIDSVNALIDDLVRPTTEVARVIMAVAEGDLSQKIALKIEGQPVKGEFLRIGTTVNTMVDQLSSFAAEVTRVAREVGTEGKLGGQAKVKGVSGTWKDLTDSVNRMASNLTDQVRNIAQVTTAVAQGDLSQHITVDVKGEILELKNTINTMVDQLSSFADEVTRVAREVGTEGKLGGQAEVQGVSGTWRGLTESVNFMASNLTDQVRNVAQVTTAVAQGDLSQKITVDVKGEILELKNTINTMVDQLSSFADEVTRVAREVGTEGKLGGQAEVQGVSGTWRGLTENVNQLAGNLTTQVRAIAEVSTAVTQGDLTRTIAVEAQGEVAELKDNINQMIANLRDTTKRNEEQDWLKTNLARISGLMQGQRELGTVTQLIMSELTPTVSAQHGAFFLAELPDGEGVKTRLRLIASYGYQQRKNISNTFELGEGLVGQAAVERKSILITEAPADYISITSGLGSAPPASIIVMPILFEEQVLGVIELASLQTYNEVHRTFLEQLMETLGVVLNTIMANMRTEQLLQQSQSLTQELQTQSEELQRRQEELKRSNTELEQQAQSLKASEELLQSQQDKLQGANDELQEKAALLEDRNLDIETKNREIELARLGLEEKAAQLALSSKYKSEFLANMSHELRTPLNSLLILSKLLLENEHGNLSAKQLEFARTIYTAGADLLQLISDILDLSKIEAGKMEILPDLVSVADVQAYVTSTFDPIAADKELRFTIDADPALPATIVSDEQRLEQVLRNLLSNAFKFTEEGGVTLSVERRAGGRIAFAVSDTGVGIPPDKLQVIFEAFQQADGTTSRKYGGTGLGLSISRELARALGGEIEVSSTVGEGTIFTLLLPLSYPRPAAHTFDLRPGETGHSPTSATPTEPAPAPVGSASPSVPGDDLAPTALASPSALGDDLAPTASASPSTPGDDLAPTALASAPVLADGADLLAPGAVRPAEGSAPPGAPATEAGGYSQQASTSIPGSASGEHTGRKVLIVDDDVRNLFALASLLEDRGMVVVFGETGKEALATLERHPDVDIVLMDIMMPDMDGNETIAAIRQTRGLRELPIIAVTAKAMEGDRKRSISAGASDYITKPVEPERLLSLIGTWLRP